MPDPAASVPDDEQQDMIYFEPVTRSLIQFPTYLRCEWDRLAPVLLEELSDGERFEGQSGSLIQVRRAVIVVAIQCVLMLTMLM